MNEFTVIMYVSIKIQGPKFIGEILIFLANERKQSHFIIQHGPIIGPQDKQVLRQIKIRVPKKRII